MLEIVARRNSLQKVLLKILQNSPRSVAWPITLLKKRLQDILRDSWKHSSCRTASNSHFFSVTFLGHFSSEKVILFFVAHFDLLLKGKSEQRTFLCRIIGIQNTVEDLRWSFQQLTIFAKSFILDMRLGSEYASGEIILQFWVPPINLLNHPLVYKLLVNYWIPLYC